MPNLNYADQLAVTALGPSIISVAVYAVVVTYQHANIQLTLLLNLLRIYSAFYVIYTG